VLSACECCDDCIDRALASLQEIRRTLVDKQVELYDILDGPISRRKLPGGRCKSGDLAEFSIKTPTAKALTMNARKAIK
jgi:hypothetical protein